MLYLEKEFFEVAQEVVIGQLELQMSVPKPLNEQPVVKTAKSHKKKYKTTYVDKNGSVKFVFRASYKLSVRRGTKC